MSTVEVYLIRHCETTANVGLWTEFHQEVVLTSEGEQQAKMLAEKIQQRPDRIILSPLKRVQDSAIPLLAKWPKVAVENWPIEEFHYLSNSKYQSVAERSLAIKKYWEKCDPNYCDGADAESFTDFMQRIASFHRRLSQLTGVNIVISHGQFIKAYLLAMKDNFQVSNVFMHYFRMMETREPIKNGEIIQLELLLG